MCRRDLGRLVRYAGKRSWVLRGGQTRGGFGIKPKMMIAHMFYFVKGINVDNDTFPKGVRYLI
jgi:hypothetical protein